MDLLLPVDTVVASQMTEGVPIQTVGRGEIPVDMEGFDIGPETARQFSEAVLEGVKDAVDDGVPVPVQCVEHGIDQRRRRPDGLRPHHVYAWRMQHPVFGDQFAASRLGFADSLVDELLEVVRSLKLRTSI